MVEGVEKSWIKEFMVRKSGVGKFMVENFMVEKLRVEKSCNLLQGWIS